MEKEILDEIARGFRALQSKAMRELLDAPDMLGGPEESERFAMLEAMMKWHHDILELLDNV